MDINLALKKLRRTQKISQKKVEVETNISQSNLSRYENSDRPIHFDDLLKLVNLYGLDLDDFNEFMYKNEEFLEIYELYMTATLELNYEKTKKIFKYFKNEKDQSPRMFLYYIKTKFFFHTPFPEAVPNITKKELAYITSQFEQKNHYTETDYDLLSILAYYLPFDDFEKYKNKLLQTVEPKITSAAIKTQCLIVLNNGMDIAIHSKNWDKAEEFRLEMENLLKHHQNTHFSIIIPFSKIVIECKGNFKKYHIRKVQEIIKAYSTLGLHHLAEAVSKEYLSLLNEHTEKPVERLVYVN